MHRRSGTRHMPLDPLQPVVRFPLGSRLNQPFVWYRFYLQSRLSVLGFSTISDKGAAIVGSGPVYGDRQMRSLVKRSIENMDYIKIRFGSDLDKIASQLEKTFDDMFRTHPVSPMFSSSECAWNPQMDIYETPEEIIVRAEIAGVEKENLEVEINSRAVKIKGRRLPMQKIDKATYRLAEIQYGKFDRILYLPVPIDTEVISSSYVNGFLQLRLAKLPREKTHTIPIEEG
jgi:HSP20 family protein